MTTFKDIFKSKFLEQFMNNISISTVVITLGIAAIFSLWVFFVYKLTTKNMVYSKSFNNAMALMSIITAAIVLSMQANIVVSLGMVGALSIVRFRTAIKEPRDLMFLFWAISNGIIIGANIYAIALFLSIIITIAMFILDLIPSKALPCLLLINCDNFKTEEKAIKILQNKKIKYRIKSRNVSEQRIDLLLELSASMYDNLIEDISKIKGIINLNLISQDGESQF